jgi:DNA invertase Pin-like site-specific DNA recombinase
LYRIISQLAKKGVEFKVLDDPSIDTSSRTGKLVMGILALIAEFENDIRRERQMDGIARFGRKSLLLPETSKTFGRSGKLGRMPEIMRRTGLSRASIYRALAVSTH